MHANKGKLAIIIGLTVASLLAQQVRTPPRPAAPETTPTVEESFQPGQKKALLYLDDRTSLTLVQGENNLKLIVRNTMGAVRTVALPPEIVQVNEIRATGHDNAIVLGMVNGSASEVVVLNTRSAQIVDTFLAYSPSVSPDGHFVAFVKFYPAHFVEGTDDHYLLLRHVAKCRREPGVWHIILGPRQCRHSCLPAGSESGRR